MVKCQIVIIFDFARQIISVATIQFCHWNESSQSHYVSKWDCLCSNKILLTKKPGGGLDLAQGL
jgi:hypothetical protein